MYSLVSLSYLTVAIYTLFITSLSFSIFCVFVWMTQPLLRVGYYSLQLSMCLLKCFSPHLLPPPPCPPPLHPPPLTPPTSPHPPPPPLLLVLPPLHPRPLLAPASSSSCFFTSSSFSSSPSLSYSHPFLCFPTCLIYISPLTYCHLFSALPPY